MRDPVADLPVGTPTSILPSAQMAIDRVTHYTQIVAGVTVFGIATVNLVTQHNLRPDRVDLYVLALPLAIWAASWLLHSCRNRARIQLIAFAVLATSPWWIPASAATPHSLWVPTGEVTFAVIIVAIMSWPRPLALLIVLLTASFEVFVTIAPPNQFIQDDPGAPGVGPWSSAVYIVIVGTGFTFWRARWLRFAVDSDNAFDASERAIAQARDASAATEAQIAANRWIHEHTLNTILAVSKSIRPENVPLLKQLAAEALERTQTMPSSSVRLSMIVHSACVTTSPTVTVRIGDLPDVEVDRDIASALRDALVEAMHNVERHAQAEHVDVTATHAGERIRVTVRDDGVGVDTRSAAGFGTSVVLGTSLISVGGTGTVEATGDAGTTITIEVPPIAMPAIAQPTTLSDQALGRVSSRLMAISPLYFGIAMALLTTADGGRSPADIAVRLTFLVCILGNAIWWLAPVGRAFGYGSQVTLAVMYVLLAWPYATGSASCTSADEYIFVTNAGLGALLVVTLGLSRGRVIWITGALLAMTAAWSALALGNRCSTLALESLVGGLTYLTLVLVAVTTIFRAADTRRAAATADWIEAERERMHTQSLVLVHHALDRTPSSATDFLAAIVDGSIDATSQGARERALREAAVIRDYLHHSTPVAGPPLA